MDNFIPMQSEQEWKYKKKKQQNENEKCSWLVCRLNIERDDGFFFLVIQRTQTNALNFVSEINLSSNC